jgi:plastocyanin
MNAPITSATRRAVRLVGAAALVVGFAACSSDDADESTDEADEADESVESAPADGTDTTEAPADPGDSADAVDASIVDFAFDPDPVAVAAGGTVTWTNNGGAPHTVTGTGELEFDSGTLAPGDVFTLTVDGAGEFAYVCTIHGQMTGTISSS